jgi:hypothetical protein
MILITMTLKHTMMLKQIVLTSLLFSFTGHLAFAGKLYKCKTAEGGYSYQQTRCQDQSQLVKSFRDGRDKQVNSKSVEFKDNSANLSYDEVATLQATFIQARASLSELKVTMQEFYMSEGSWPSNLKALSFSQENLKTELIDGVQIKQKGAILSRLSDKLGENKHMLLVPEDMGEYFRWKCYANFTKEQMAYKGDKSLCHSKQLK